MAIVNTPQQNIVAMVRHTRTTAKQKSALDVVARKVGVCRNTLAAVRVNSGKRVKQQLEREIAQAAFNMLPYPWSFSAERLCWEIKTAILERECAFQAPDILKSRWEFLIRNQLIDQLLRKPAAPVSEDDWGSLVAAYLYQTGVCFGSLSTHLAAEDNEIFDLVSELLREGLQPYSDQWWAVFLRFQVQSNGIGLKWNATAGKSRNGDSMRRLIVDSGYLEELLGYMKRCPRDQLAIENGLAYASRLGLSDYYGPFRDLLIRAHGGQEPAYTTANGFDDDFDGYRRWLSRDPGRVG